MAEILTFPQNPSTQVSEDWEDINPIVSAEAEFYEIVNDFGSPLEIIREAISNSWDAGATEISIEFGVRDLDGARKLVIDIEDNGRGMSRQQIMNDFWGLGFSNSRERTDAIGEKGHGTKIYLRSEKVTVQTRGIDGSFEAECNYPLRALARRSLHQPRVHAIPEILRPGTHISIIGYNNDERSNFVSPLVTDYIQWFTKAGSVDSAFSENLRGMQVKVKTLNSDDFEIIRWGHPFPDENSDINTLFKEFEEDAAEHYVRRYIYREQRLPNYPEIKFDAIFSVEGDAAKQEYNKMIRERRGKSGFYRVGDRYGLWLCKDYIPVVRVNDWLNTFGSGSNAYVLLHAFVNCQSLKLTANRGTVSNTDPDILTELECEVRKLIQEVDVQTTKDEIYTLKQWRDEARTLLQEKTEFERRTKALKNKRTIEHNGTLLIEPKNEAELLGLFLSVYTLHPDWFDFQPLDYNAQKGIDMIARNSSSASITEGEHSYVEFKFLLKTDFNHAFKNLRWVLCWDFDKKVTQGSEFRGIEENDVRRLEITQDDMHSSYFLDNRTRNRKVEVVRFKEMLKERGVDFA